MSSFDGYGISPRILPAVLAQSGTTGDVATTFLNLANCHMAELVVMLGAITDDTTVLTFRESTGSDSTSDLAIPFTYRLSAALGTDTGWGAVTTCDSGGLTLAVTDDNKVLIVHFNPADLTDGYKYIHGEFATGGSTSAFALAAIWLIDPRYATLDTQSDS